VQFDDVVRHRRMVRDFDDRPLAPEAVERIVANALRGPSAGFAQGVELLVLHGPSETRRFWAASQPSDGDPARGRRAGLMRAPLLVVVYADPGAYDRRYAEPDKAGVAPASTWAVPWWHVDAAFAAMLMLLTAVDAGLGALFFGVTDPDGLRAEFGVAAGYQPVGAVAVGRPAPGTRPSRSAARGRRPAAEVVHRGNW
jgi:nitroreductase